MLKVLVAALTASSLAALQYAPPFEAARVRSSPFGGFPYGSQAAGLVVLEVDVDARGLVGGVNIVKELDPFGPVLRDAVSSWVFEPAREGGRAVEHPILVVGLFRPAAVMFPAPPPPPAPPSDAPHSIPYPTSVGIPSYPPNRIGVAAVLVEVEVDAGGAVTSAQVGGEETGFDDASLDAARGWIFRPAQRDRRDVPSRAYLLFVFRQPGT